MPSDLPERNVPKAKRPRNGAPAKWHEFELVSDELAILRGASSTHSARFKPGSRGQQDSAACCVAAVLGHLLEAADWRAELIEGALDWGDRLYRVSRARQPRLPGRPPGPLACCQLEPEFYVGDYRCRVCVQPDFLRANSLCDLERALSGLLLGPEAVYGVLAARGTPARFGAIWARPDNGLFHFEPGPQPDGVACLARCAGPRALRERLERCLGVAGREAGFCFDRLSLVRVEPVGRGEWRSREAAALRLEPRLLRAFAGDARGAAVEADVVAGDGPLRRSTPALEARAPADDRGDCCRALPERRLDGSEEAACRELWANVPSSLGPLPREPAAAILHGLSHEGSEVYRARGAQTLANCAVAFAMRRLRPVRTWLRQTLDDVLAAGDELYARLKTDDPGVVSVGGADLHNAELQIDGRKMIVDVDLLTVVGTIVSKVVSVVNLKQGLHEFFANNRDGIFECSSLAVALWQEDDYYYLFDPRSCDVNGLHVHAAGGKGESNEPTTGKKTTGKCCVVRFPNLASLDAHLLRNIDATASHDRFIIRRITIVDDVTGTRCWNYFEPAAAGKSWILQGTINCDSDIFDDHSRGAQGLAIAVVALISAKTIEPVDWFKDDVDDVIRQGDQYYNWCVPNVGESGGDEDDDKTLGIADLKKNVYYKQRKVVIAIKESCIMGNLQATNDIDDTSLESGICSFFKEQQLGVVEANKRFFAIWKFEAELKDKSKETSYYLIHGNPTQAFLNAILTKSDKIDVSACLFRFHEATEVAAMLSQLLQVQHEEDKMPYFIHQVQVASIGEPMTDEEIQKDKATPAMPDLRNYVGFGVSGAALAGSFSQNNQVMFKRETRDKQQAASTLVTLAMTTIFSPYLWYREVVDDLLKMADKMTRDNLKNLPEADEEDADNARDYLLPSDLENDFTLGVNQISVGLEEETFTGKPDDLQQHLQDFFSTNRMGVYRQGKVILPIWREKAVYFTMDPVGKQAGNACVYWFVDVQSLAEILLECSDKSDASFVLDTVTVENKFTESERLEESVVTEEHWYNFATKAQGIWEINCEANDDTDERVEQDKNSTAISVMAIIFSKAYEPRFWSRKLLDEIAAAGKMLHSQSVLRLGEDRPLRVNEVIQEFFVADRRIDLTVQDCVQAGQIISQRANIQSLRSGCVKFFENFSAGCVSLAPATLAPATLAIWTIDDYFYSFRPGHSLMRFESLASLADQLETSGDGSSDFEITNVEVVDWNKLPPWKFDPSPAVRPCDLPPLNAYSRMLGKARAILRGFTHQESEIFPDNVRARQGAANCIVSLAMAVIKNPVTWTRKTLDEILVFGLNLHLESLDNSAKSSFSLRPRDIVRIFQMGPNIMVVDVDAATVAGLVEQPPAESDQGAKEKKATKPTPDKATAKDRAKKSGNAKRVRPEPPPGPLLAAGLDRFFENNSAGVLVAGRSTLALWRASGVYFVYDPRPRDSQGSKAQPASPAASCVCWFACKQPLARLIAANLDEDDKYASYEIFRVVARRLQVEALPAVPGCRAHANGFFERLDEQLSVLAGSSHMASSHFHAENRGLQSCAIAGVALVVAAIRAPPRWTPELLDAVLRHGDRLHSECTQLRRQGLRNLAPAELPRVLAVGELRARVHLDEGLAAGISLERDLLQALALFFAEASSTAGILHTTSFALALVRHSGKFYLLDPSERNPFARRGVACLLRCDSLPTLARAVVAVFAFARPTLYTLNGLRVEELHFFAL